MNFLKAFHIYSSPEGFRSQIKRDDAVQRATLIEEKHCIRLQGLE